MAADKQSLIHTAVTQYSHFLTRGTLHECTHFSESLKMIPMGQFRIVVRAISLLGETP